MSPRPRIAIFLALVLMIVPLLTGIAGPSANNISKNKVLIAFDRQPGSNEEALVRNHGGEVKYTYHLVPAIAASIPEAAIKGLQNNPRVLRIEPDVTVHAIGELENSWGVDHIDADLVHAINTGAGVSVAIIDSGIDYEHPDLFGNYAGGYDFVNGDIYPYDDNGHGTHVAGTVAAVKDDNGVVGVAPQAEIYALKVLDASGSGYFSDIIAAVEWAAEHGIEVTNNSYGSSSDPGLTVKAAFDKTYNAGTLHIAAAGNSGNRPGKGDNVGYPAHYASVIAVAATDRNDKRASFSSTGPEVELSAPGVSIKSTVPGGYAVYSGTSMASPHVTGTAALIIASGVTSSDNIRAKLQQTADDLGALGRDTYYGYGLVDTDEAAELVNGAPVVTIISPTDGSTFASGESIPFEGVADDTEDGLLTSSLQWTSSIEGSIGSGGSFSQALSDGTHIITAKATDSNNKTGSASISITVGSSTEVPTVSVASVSYNTEGGRYKDSHLRVNVNLNDNLDNPVVNASVNINLKLHDELYLSAAGTTDADGTVTFKANNAPSGTYTTKLTDVTAAGYTWDGNTPYNTFEK